MSLSRCIAFVVLVAASLLLVPVTAQAAPTVVHAPVATAYYGTSIEISARAKCTDPACVAAVVYRETARAPTEAPGPWVRRALQPAAADAAGFVPFTGQIPAQDVSTRGVDYYVEAVDGAQVGRQPLTAPEQPLHVHTLSPPVVAHVPPAYAQADKNLPLEISSSCSTKSCTAKLYFRTSPAGSPASTSKGLVSLGTPSSSAYADPRGWEHVTMDRSAISALGEPGDLETWKADVPARIVDTKGVDYIFSVSDGKTTTWMPGTAYQGYLPQDGEPTSAYHVHVVEPPRIVHVPPATTAYRKAIPITATSTCPIGRTCTGRLYYRTTTRTVLDSLSDFQSVAMTATPSVAADALGTVTVKGEIPASVADTRGVDYFFSISDGSRTAWYPGTSAIDGPVSVDGTRVAYGHLRVLEPPHIGPQPVINAKQLKPLKITTTVTCVTEHCDVELYHAQSYLTGLPRSYSKLVMTKVADGQPTPVGKTATYEATIPAEAVTTRGVAWFIRAWDGYVQTFSPGTPYSGAYVPVGNTRPGSITLYQAFPSIGEGLYGEDDPGFNLIQGSAVIDTGADLAWLTRVLEPPHVIHAPVLTVAPDRQIAIEAYSNCIAPTCTGRLTWRDRNGEQQTVVMKAAKAASVPESMQADAQDVWHFTATIPRRDVTDDPTTNVNVDESGVDATALNYRISVDDGYTSDTTTTYPVVVSDRGLASVGGHAFVGKAPELYVDSALDLEGVSVTATAVVNGTALPVPVGNDITDGEGRYAISDLPSGEYDIGIDPASLPAGHDPAVQPIKHRVTVALGQRVRGKDIELKAVDRDQDELADFLEPRYGIPAGTDSDSDDDSLKDGFEVRKLYPVTHPDKADTDSDGTPDAQEDPDNDTLINASEQAFGSHPRKVDSDEDGLKDGYEIEELFPDAMPDRFDSDGDGVSDGEEDFDEDDLSNVAEQEFDVSPRMADTDGDGLKDGFELKKLTTITDPKQADSDTDGTPDGQEDLDQDTLSNATEQDRGSDPVQADADADDLDDPAEHQRDTQPDKADSDDDGLDDGAEVRSSTDPNDPDSDDDGSLDGDEELTSTATRGDVTVSLTGRGDLSGALETRVLPTESIPPTGQLGQVGKAWDIHLDDNAREGFQSAKITLPIPTGYTGNSADLQIFTFNEEQRVWLPASRSQQVNADGTVTASVDHFSTYTLFEFTNWQEEWTSTVAGCDGQPPAIDLSIVFDVGYSTQERDTEGLRRQIARRFVDALGPQDRVAIAEVDDSYTTRQGLTSDKALAHQGIDRVVHYGRPTEMEQVIHAGIAPLKAGGPRQLNRARVMLVLSSGYDGYSQPDSRMDGALYDAYLGNVTIFPVSAGHTPNTSTLEYIANDSGGAHHHVATSAELPEITERITRHDGLADMDDDNVHDCDEASGILTTDSAELLFTDPSNPDTDGDGLEDGEELGQRKKTTDIAAYGTTLSDETGTKRVYSATSDPSAGKADTDGDHLDDMQEYDDASSAWSADGDGDELSDVVEKDLQTDPLESDTDGDDISDHEEDQKRDHDPLSYNEKVNRFIYAIQFGRGVSGGLLGTDSDSVPYLLGNITGGFVGISDVGEVITSLLDGNSVAAGVALVGLVPVAGDALKSSVKLTEFIRANPEKSDDVYRAVFGIDKLPPTSRQKLLEAAAAACRIAPGGAAARSVAAGSGGCDDPARLGRLQAKGLTEDMLAKLFRGRPGNAAYLEDVLDNATVIARADPDNWIPPSATWRDAEKRVQEKFGLGERFKLNGFRNRHADSYNPGTKTIHESKRGYQCGRRVRSEAQRDREVVKQYPSRVQNVEWHFVISDLGDGRVNLGPCKKLLDELKGDPANGIPPIPYKIYLP